MALFKKKEPTLLEKEIADMETRLRQLDPDSDEYQQILSELERLVKLDNSKSEKKKWKVSPDTIFNGLVSTAGVLIIVGYEHAHCITSKALSVLKKVK